MKVLLLLLALLALGATVRARLDGDKVFVGIVEPNTNRWRIETSDTPTGTNWTWCLSDTTGTNEVGFLTWSNQMFFRAVKLP